MVLSIQVAWKQKIDLKHGAQCVSANAHVPGSPIHQQSETDRMLGKALTEVS